jgi:DnaJ-class molecular chaperone
MIYLIVLIGGLGILFLIFKSGNIFSKFTKCNKCEGLGYWVGTRGDKQNCDICRGSGKVPKA